MNSLKKLLAILLLALASLTGKTIAYTYTITNTTRQDMQVKLYYKFITTRTLMDWKEVKAGETRKFYIPNAYCLTKVEVKHKTTAENWGKPITMPWGWFHGKKEIIGKCGNLVLKLKHSYIMK